MRLFKLSEDKYIVIEKIIGIVKENNKIIIATEDNYYSENFRLYSKELNDSYNNILAELREIHKDDLIVINNFCVVSSKIDGIVTESYDNNKVHRIEIKSKNSISIDYVNLEEYEKDLNKLIKYLNI